MVEEVEEETRGAAGGPGDQHSTVPGLRQGPGVAKEAEAPLPAGLPRDGHAIPGPPLRGRRQGEGREGSRAP